jgi:hypothetical protein
MWRIVPQNPKLITRDRFKNNNTQGPLYGKSDDKTTNSIKQANSEQRPTSDDT